jgi:hypothetical protein
MPVYRGPGGAGDATNDATVTAVQAAATAAATSATNAANSATAAATSASGAATSATNASNSATTAAGSVATAAGHASSASTFATNASLSATDAEDAATEAEGYASEAFDYKVEASVSAASAASSASSATASQLAAETAALAVDDVLTDPDFITVLGLSDELQTVANNSANITAVANNSTNINAVAANETNIDLVAANLSDIGVVAELEADIDTVAGISANVTTVAGISSNVTTVAGISANVTTVATNNANVTTVATNIASVNTNATNIANINQNAANIVAIQNASANATAAASSATAAAGSATSASASAAAASAVALGNEPVRHSVRPSLLLDFANTKTLDPRITFTRASTGTFYDGKTVAKAEENLFTYSQEFDNAAWTKIGGSIVANDAVAPDGTTTAEKLNEATSTAEFQIRQTAPSVTTFTASIFAKAAQRDKLYIQFSATSNEYIFFDLTAGTVAGSQLTTTTNTSSRSSAITSVGNGWYRCSITVTLISAAAPSIRFGVSDTIVSATPNYAGTAGNGIHIWGAQVEARSSITAYTATTTAPITNYIPALQSAASGVARFEHNPTTGESLGLEIEEQRTNLLTYSSDFSNAAWTKNTLTAVSNAIIAPDGTLTGDKLISTGITNSVEQQISKSASAITYTQTFYAKAGEWSWVHFAFFDMTSAGNRYWFNLSTGVVGSIGLIGAGFTSVSSSITAVGNGWYRCTATATSSSTTALSSYFYPTTGDTVTTAGTGNTFNGIYIWGAQLEAGAFATSYIPTVASQVTRSVDNAQMTGSNFSSWYKANEGTLYADYVRNGLTLANSMFTIGDGTLANRIGFITGSSVAGQNRFDIVKDNAGQAALLMTTETANTPFKAIGSYAVNNIAATENGLTVQTDTTALIPVVDRANIGSLYGSALNPFNGTIKKLSYYGKRLTDAEIQSLTVI